jgi:cytochrome c
MREVEKVVVAIAIAIFIFIFSDNIGRIIYGPNSYFAKQGYVIPIEDRTNTIEAKANPLTEVLDMETIMAAADSVKGEAIFKKVCTLCHNADKGGPNKVGPNLWNIYNNHGAHKDDFSYSAAMLSRKEILWNDEELYRYLYSPKQYVVGTKMSFAGVKDDKERADVVAYLKTLRDE